jgi:hypothetical protein
MREPLWKKHYAIPKVGTEIAIPIAQIVGMGLAIW